MNKFKVGDRVRSINGEESEKTGIIVYCNDSAVPYRVDFSGEISWKAEVNLELVKQEYKSIHITVKDRTTHAILKQGNQVIKRAKAVCNPSDEFNFEYGANIAFQRLIGNEVKHEVIKVKRQAKVGEWIKIVDAMNTDDCYNNGDIFKVVEVKKGESDGVYIDTVKTHSTCSGILGRGKGSYVWTKEYVVLENYNPQQQPKLDLTKVSGSDLFAEVKRRMELSDNV